MIACTCIHPPADHVGWCLADYCGCLSPDGRKAAPQPVAESTRNTTEENRG